MRGVWRILTSSKRHEGLTWRFVRQTWRRLRSSWRTVEGSGVPAPPASPSQPSATYLAARLRAPVSGHS